MKHIGTSIDGPRIEPEGLFIRDMNLNDLIGTVSFVSAVYHILNGRLPSQQEEEALDRYLVYCVRDVGLSPHAADVVHVTHLSGAGVSRILAAAFMPDATEQLEKARDFGRSMFPLNDDLLVALYYLAVSPLIVALSSRRGGEELALSSGGQGIRYVHLFYQCFSDKAVIGCYDFKLLNAVLVAQHGGFGYLTPTVLLPRVAISTHVSIPQAMAAQFLGAGPAHVGAIEGAMNLLMSMAEDCQNLDVAADRLITEYRSTRRRLPGFGHPLFERDPRVSRLRALLVDYQVGSKYLDCFDELIEAVKDRLGVWPNIDGIAAAILLTLGVPPDDGTGVFLCARLAATIAHIMEKKSEPAFGQHRAEARRSVERSLREYGLA